MYKVKTKDKIVQNVIKKMDERSLIGQKKYGSTMHDEVTTNKKDLRDFLIDTQEEILDALLYIESARACLQEEIEECYINDKHQPVRLDYTDEDERRMNMIGLNGNDGEHYDMYWKADHT